ncbi:MAG: hypothetical protein IJT94_14955, partial [Oscillibacter sp.]|nr:hypothetical protein [Oscillibacter sp.]
MVLWKRILFLFSLFALFLGALWYPFRTTLTERYYVLAYGEGDRVYLRAAEGENGLICAASRDGADRVLSAEKRTDGLELRFFNQQGDVLGDWFAPFPDAALKGELCALYPVDLQTAFLAFWQDGDGGNQELCVYRAGKNSVPELLLTQRGSGSSPVHQRESLQISSFSRSLNEVFFVLFQNDNAVSYVCPIAGGGVQKKEEQVRGSGDIVSAAALPNGSLVLAGEGFLNVPGRTNTGVSAGQKISHLTCMASGIYFVEDHTLSVWYSDLTGSSTQALLSLDTVATGHRITSLTLTPAGEALLLMNGSSLSLVRSGGVTDLTSVLYPSWSNSLLAVLFHVLGAVFLAFLVWQVFSIVAQSRIPLSLYWGTVVLALTLVISVAAHVSILLYANRYTTLKHHSELFGSVVGMAMREDSRDAAPLPGGGTVSRHAYSADFLARRMEAMLQDAGVMNTG